MAHTPEQGRKVPKSGRWPCLKPHQLLLALWGVLFLPSPLPAQADPTRFEEEVALLREKTGSLRDPGKPAIVFTGSSSIRMWEDLGHRFPQHQVLNLGFGGSRATDLLYYLDPLVLDWAPERVFLYEGDNDLAEGRKPRQVLRTLEEIALRIQGRYPGTPLVFIAAKPSLSRWHLRGKYRRFNRRLQRWTRKSDTLFFADIWGPMLLEKAPDATLFIEDGLHMNGAGYDIWERVLEPFMPTPSKIPYP